MYEFYSKYKEKWITELMLYKDTNPDSDNQNDAMSNTAVRVLKQKLRQALGLRINEEENIVESNHNVFKNNTGENTIKQIVRNIASGKIVVLDTSNLGDEAELIVGSMIASDILNLYKTARAQAKLHQKPVATIVIEEAPRVIGEDVLKSRNNIYSTIAREGRKFQVGLTAITQLSSVIPKTILANMNTKMILGNELKLERQAIIESASQDLSEDDRNIAGLDLGEAIISSIYVPFALPIKIPNFQDVVEKVSGSKPRMKVF
ncbi:MAG: ATP-binding protein [Cenarchaeum sp. SB0664_bin_35]|nr:ATP-binding protein [Cenarchaeum sp. SB0664_bin_35]